MILIDFEVRQKSREVSTLLSDDSKLKELRNNRGRTRDRIGYDNERVSHDMDDDLARAIKESKEQARLDEERRLRMQE